MKKTIIATLIIILGLFIFSSCGETTKRYEIGEMKFSITDNFEQITDNDEIIQHFIDTGSVESKKAFKDTIDNALLFYGDDYTLTISEQLNYFNDNELEECIKSTFVGDTSYWISNDISIGTVKGKIGEYRKGSTETHFMLLLHNGYFYIFELALYDGESYPENYLEDIASTIVFEPDLIKDKTVKCGDISIQIPENYLELKIDNDELSHDASSFGLFGDNYVEIDICYILSPEFNNCTIDEAVDLLPSAYDMEDYRFSSDKCSLGECKAMSGTNVDGETCIVILLEYKDKIYWFDMYFAEEPDPQYLYEIVNTATDINDK